MICANCGRLLLTKKSRELGYGPVCYRKIYGAPAPGGRKSDTHPEALDHDLPGQINFDDYLRDIGQ